MTVHTAAILQIIFSLAAFQAQAASIVFAPVDSASPQAAADCTTYHGTYGKTAVYIVQDECTTRPEDWLDSGSVIFQHALEWPYDILYAERAALEQPAAGDWLHSVEQHVRDIYATASLEEKEQSHNGQAQTVLAAAASSDEAHVNVLASPQPLLLEPASETSAFFAVSTNLKPVVDQLFPPEAVLVAVPWDPLPSPSNLASLSAAPKWLEDALDNLRFSVLIDALIQDVSADDIEKDVRHLTNEDGKAGWMTRHSFTQGAKDAAKWIQQTVESEGGAKCRFEEHHYGFSPNVICEYTGEESSDELVVMGAHYDARGTFGHIRAPGGDDDGSGTSALLSLARLFRACNVKFKRTVVLAFFSGEEQGLQGSRVYAKTLKDREKNVRFMLQADMLGYHLDGEPMQIAFPDRYDTIEARWLVGNISLIYEPQLQVGTTPACCSDHQSFNEQGYVSTWVFERNGPIADPKYHNSWDISHREGYDFQQIAAIARVMFATVLEVAGFRL